MTIKDISLYIHISSKTMHEVKTDGSFLCLVLVLISVWVLIMYFGFFSKRKVIYLNSSM